MWAPNPITFSRTSFWKPVRMATETNITVSPNPMLRMAIRTMGREKFALFFDNILRAIKSSVFNDKCLSANVRKLTIFAHALPNLGYRHFLYHFCIGALHDWRLVRTIPAQTEMVAYDSILGRIYC